MGRFLDRHTVSLCLFRSIRQFGSIPRRVPASIESDVQDQGSGLALRLHDRALETRDSSEFG